MQNHQNNVPASLSPLSVEILGYLEKNPGACDTLTGIARWWLLRHRIEAITTDVKTAIDELVRLGLLVKTSRSNGQPLYRLSQKRNR